MYNALNYFVTSQMLVPPKLSENRLKGHVKVVAGVARVLINLDKVVIGAVTII